MTNMSQEVRDAMADAETFMRVLGICYPTSQEAYAQAYHGQWAAGWALRHDVRSEVDGPMVYGRMAARAAFRACPGLRG